MKTTNDFLHLLNKIDLDIYLEYNNKENFDYIKRILIDDFDSIRIENTLIVLDCFVNYFDIVNNVLFGYW